MEDLINIFLEHLANKRASKNTISGYNYDLKRFSEFLIDEGITSFDKVNKTNVMSYLLYLQENEKATCTISRQLACIKSFYNFLFYEKLIYNNPVREIETYKVIRADPRTLTQKEVNILMKAPDTKTIIGKRDRAMLEVLYATGIQVTEVINLKITDVHLDTKFISCRTSKHERLIPIGRKAKDALKSYLNIRNELLKDKEELNFLFLNVKGFPISRQGVFKIIREYGLNSGINIEVTPKILRHSFARHMLINGAEITAVQEMMGHKEPSTTQIYLENRHYRLMDVYSKYHPRYK